VRLVCVEGFGARVRDKGDAARQPRGADGGWEGKCGWGRRCARARVHARPLLVAELVVVLWADHACGAEANGFTRSGDGIQLEEV